jgi:hypothetical protein
MCKAAKRYLSIFKKNNNIKYKAMVQIDSFNIDEETISKLGLRLCDEPINAEIARDARVFVYPHLDKVFVMESDLYGNTMPKDSCFLAFYGQHGLIGKHLKVETLKNASLQDMKAMVQSNIDS